MHPRFEEYTQKTEVKKFTFTTHRIRWDKWLPFLRNESQTLTTYKKLIKKQRIKFSLTV